MPSMSQRPTPDQGLLHARLAGRLQAIAQIGRPQLRAGLGTTA
ncbi:hypothetical protein ACWGCI_37745 [Streptomyces sp. NPDC054949]